MQEDKVETIGLFILAVSFLVFCVFTFFTHTLPTLRGPIDKVEFCEEWSDGRRVWVTAYYPDSVYRKFLVRFLENGQTDSPDN